MASSNPLIITLRGGHRVDVQVGAHRIQTDQPLHHGGEDAAPSPFDLFLASVGACAGYFVEVFCARRGLSTEGIELRERPRVDEAGTLRGIELELLLPPTFPERYRAAVVRAVEQCSVKRAIAAQPEIEVRVAGPAPAPIALQTAEAAPAARLPGD